jgi:hypothetical protein
MRAAPETGAVCACHMDTSDSLDTETIAWQAQAAPFLRKFGRDNS